MKKTRRQQLQFKELKKNVFQIKQIVSHTKVANLFSHEAAVRKKIKQLKEMNLHQFKHGEQLLETYRELFDEISLRLLEDYNDRNHSSFDFNQIVKDYEAVYLQSGILTALVGAHIPALLSDVFKEKLHVHPKEDFPLARQLKRKVILHLGDTNTGKTHNAIQALKRSRKGIYLAPLRILALEIFERLNDEGVITSLLTGEEEVIHPNAHHVSCTVEKSNLDLTYDVAVIDEIQLISDTRRGAAWTRALLGLRCEEIHVCGAKQSKDLLLTLIEDCGDEIEVHEYERLVPLVIKNEPFKYQDVQLGDALILFSKRRVLQTARMLQERGIDASMIYGDLPPEVRKLQYHAFASSENAVVVTTDAIGMGVNLPIRRIVFLEIEKFDGEETRQLKSQEVKQIAGRAGRRGHYEVGYVSGVGKTSNFLKRQIEAVDPMLDTAIVGPNEVLLEIEGLPLKEKLALWSTTPLEITYFEKMDVRDFQVILSQIARYHLDERIQWRLMKLPIDVTNYEVMALFNDYVVSHFVLNQEELSKPYLNDFSLEGLESYYQEINLYYSFSKNFQLYFDLAWVEQQRIAVSEKINELLIRGDY